MEGRQESNEVSVKLNELTKKIKNVTRSMMAKVSELSMHQALAMNLFQEKSEKETLIESISARVIKGDIPVEFIEKELIQAEKVRQLRESQLRDARERASRNDLGKFVHMYVFSILTFPCYKSIPLIDTNAPQGGGWIFLVQWNPDNGRAPSECVHSRALRSSGAPDPKAIWRARAVPLPRAWCPAPALQEAHRKAGQDLSALNIGRDGEERVSR